MFFGLEGETRRARRRRIIAAKKMCRDCPVEIECLAGALDRREAYGVWGGLTTQERRDILSVRDDADRAVMARLVEEALSA